MVSISLARMIPLAGLLFLALELTSIILVGQALGVLPTILITLCDLFIGIFVIRTAGIRAMEQLKRPLQRSHNGAVAVGGMALRGIAGILFIVPGFFSDFLAVLLLSKPVRRWLARRFAPLNTRSYHSPPSGRAGSVTIIEGEAVEITGQIVGKPDDEGNQVH